MAYIQEKTKGKKIVSFKSKACMGRDANGKQTFKCKTWYPPPTSLPQRLARKPKRWRGSGRKKRSKQKIKGHFFCGQCPLTVRYPHGQ